jgi:hypothetical protein
VNAAGLSFATALGGVSQEARWLWLAVFAAGSLFAAASLDRRDQTLWKVQIALMATSLGLFLATRESRLLPPFMVAASLSVGLALQALWERARNTLWAGVPVVVAAALPVLLLPLSDARAGEIIAYYRVLDGSMMRAAAWVDAHHGDGVVVVREDRRGWPMGWWFEGLTGARVAVGANPKWLAFPEERENAHLAARLFIGRGGSAEAAELAARHDVDLLVFRKWDWIGWQAWLAEPQPALRVVYDDGDFMVLEVGDSTATAGLGR